MENEIISKFKKGDRVLVEDEESWCNGCTGTVKGVWWLPKGSPYYLVSLDESPSAYIRDTYIYERSLKKANG